MRPLLEPVGPLGAGTYWRRRLLLIAVLVVALWLVTRLGGDDGSASANERPVSVTEPSAGPPRPTPSPGSDSTDASPAPSGTLPPTPVPPTGAAGKPVADPAVSAPAAGAPAQVRPCTDADLVLSVAADTARYAPDAKPVLKLAVGTTGAAPCTRDLGPAALGLVITSGQDRIWGSQDCSTAPADVRVITPGTPVTLEIAWDRVRSQPGCASAGSAARPGYYVVTPVAGKVTGQQTSFLLD